MPQVYIYEIIVDASAIDGNGHANNVEFVRWMQDAAVAHSDSAGCTQATKDAGATWVARSHHIEYLKPAFAGDRLHVRTWVHDFRRAFSLRKYEFVRPTDDAVLARGETDWVYVDLQAGRPRSIPPGIAALFDEVPRGA